MELVREMARRGGTPFVAYNLCRWPNQLVLRRALMDVLGVVLDFDGTATDGNQWLELRGKMIDEHRLADSAEADEYFRGIRSDEGDVAFLKRSIGRMAASDMRHAHVQEAAARLRPREGVARLVSRCGAENVAVVSFGIHPFIAAWTDAHGIPIRSDHVFAARLEWRDGFGSELHIAGCVEGTIVVEATKAEKCAAFARRRGLAGRRLLVFEDTPSMLRRMKPVDAIGGLVVPLTDHQPGRHESRMRHLTDEANFAAIDVAIVSDSLEPIILWR